MTTIAKITAHTIRVGMRNQTLVRVETDDGTVGWGESGLSSREKSVCAMVDIFADILVGQDSRRIGRIWQELYRSQYFEGGRVITAAISAIDIALYDILGKQLGVPVYQLLGGKHRDVVPSFATATAPDPADMLNQVQVLLDDGFECVRVAPSYYGDGRTFEARKSIAATVKQLVAVRELIGPDIALGIDYHHRLTPAEAASFCNMLPAGVLDFLEEPIRDETPEAYEMLRSMTSVPFAVGEEFASKWQAGPYLDKGLTQYMRIDICNVGGFTEAMKIAGWSERHYIDLMPHNPLGPICTAATAHMSAAVPNLSWVETRQSRVEELGFHDKKIFPTQAEIVGPNYIVSDAPGLGVEVDEDALREAENAAHVECPHLIKPDGSVTNW
ncbi:mandelate racemase/muconate lactonizing enzyme family protein [Cognatishimia sp. SS12]|uniref:mandelate racemase/muconate lactonizing enzyme family protein n=1 Tax=Cognatishimia sp. SS12 TaxID=2979465 RepID=UPI00232E76ED|nr:mandelate racemase/muconate lactonizing enzyme family protein [Cognatishimia sp. SS12]MDC0739594.1 mandelate racemase/muconate lactonizing enzyme family protein [Cognatishimia sp. SS12]